MTELDSISEPMSPEEKARLQREIEKTRWWKEIFEYEYNDQHDLLEEAAFSSNDIHRRYALIEAVKALRVFRDRFEEILLAVGGGGDADSQDYELIDDDTS